MEKTAGPKESQGRVCVEGGSKEERENPESEQQAAFQGKKNGSGGGRKIREESGHGRNRDR